MMKRLLITGVSGLLGVNLAFRAADRYRVIGVSHLRQLSGAPFETIAKDLTDAGTMDDIFDLYRPDIVIHCAALANIDEAERDPQRAWQVNAELPGILATKACRHGVRLVHISTDAVFDGVRGDYRETDTPNPISAYAKSKLGGEQAVASIYPQAAIARVNFYGWSLDGRRSLAEFFFNHLSAGQSVKGFIDVFFCPLYVKHLADILLEMAEKELKGIYHTVSRESLSKYEFGRMIAGQFNFNNDLVQPVRVAEGGLVAARSPNLTLRVEKLEHALGKILPGIEMGLKVFHQQYVEKYPQLLRSYWLTG